MSADSSVVVRYCVLNGKPITASPDGKFDILTSTPAWRVNPLTFQILGPKANDISNT